MIPYNTDLKKLVLPEYGRLVHDMIEVCCGIEDRDTRNEFAATIVETMKSMTQEKGKLPDDSKYWDHLFLISGYNIDVDSPFGRPEPESLSPKPEKIPYSAADFSRRHYGLILQRLVREVSLMENSEEKDACVELLANHIKKLLVINSEENSGDSRVYDDLSSMSGGVISLKEDIFMLPEYKEEKPVKAQKRKKNH